MKYSMLVVVSCLLLQPIWGQGLLMRPCRTCGQKGAESATEKTRKAVAELFPGWSLDTEVANHDWAGIQAFYRGQTNVVFIHPVNRETPAIVSRTVMLSDKNPCLHLKVASHSEDHDFGLSVRVDGKDALPRRRICTQDFAPWEDVFVPLSKWRGGMAKIEIVLTGINRWTCEFPYFACIEICEGTGDTRIDGKATVDGYAWSYRVNNGEAMIVAESDGRMTCAVSPSPIGHVTIPETLDGVKVTGIGYNAFCDCSGITSVTIPSTVKIIGRGAFARCRGLTSLAIPDGVVDIGRESFLGCTGLASMTIPDSVKGVWRNAFRGCAGLTSLAIPSGVTNIEGEAFRGCCALTEVTISSTVTNIDGTAFCDCSALTAVHVDDGNWFHDGNQFYKSENGLLLTKDGTTLVRGVMGDVTVPSSVTNIGSCAFEGCCALRSIQIPSSVKVIGPYAFRNCKGLASVMIPEGVTGIGHDAFHGCSGLESVTLPKGVEIICNSAFTGTALTSVEIPSGVKTLERGAFSWCGGLKSVTIPESVTSIGRDVFYNCGALESVNIPTGVTSIGQGAFCGCNGLSSVEIPETVAKIDQQAFLNCRGLKSVTMRGSCPASPNNVFEGCGNLKTIHVPANSRSWAGLKEWQGKTLAFDGPKMSDEQLAKESEQQAKSAQMQNKDRPRTLGGALRARRLQRQQEAQAAAEKQQTELTAQEKAQREVEREEQRQQLLAIQEELKRVRAAKAAAAVDNIKGAVTTWMLVNKKSMPPSSLSALVKADGDKKPQLDGGEEALVDPWGQSYMIQIKGKWFAIVSAGPDTKFHTADDIRTDNGGDKEQGAGRLVRTSEAKAPAVKNQGLAASTNCEKSALVKISVAEKLQSCDFLLNKDFKKNAKVYLCLFSASWCPPCRAEMPRIAKTYAETLKDDPDIELVHFSRDREESKAMDWAKKHDVKFPVVRYDGGNPLNLHCNGIPHLFIVKDDGTLLEEGHPMRLFTEAKLRALKDY